MADDVGKNTNSGKKKKIAAIVVSAVAVCVIAAVVILLLLRSCGDDNTDTESGGSETPNVSSAPADGDGNDGGDITDDGEDLVDDGGDEDPEPPEEPEIPSSKATAGDEKTLRELLLEESEIDIELTADVETPSRFIVNGTKRLTGNHTVSYKMDGIAFQPVFELTSGVQMILDGPTVDGNYCGGGFIARDGATLEIVSGSIKRIGNTGINALGATVMIKDGTFSDFGAYGLFIQDDSKAYIEGGTFTGSVQAAVNVGDGCYLSVTGNPVFKDPVGGYTIWATIGSVAEIHGGSYDGGGVGTIGIGSYGKLDLFPEDGNDEIEICGYTSWGIAMSRKATEANISHVYIHDCYTGMKNAAGVKTVFEHSRVENCTQMGLAFNQENSVSYITDVKVKNIANNAAIAAGGETYIRDVEVEGAAKNSGVAVGGSANAIATLTNVTIDRCFNGVSAFSSDAVLNMTGGSITNCTNHGARISGKQFTFTDVDFTDNTSAEHGAAFNLNTKTCTAEFKDCLFERNIAAGAANTTAGVGCILNGKVTLRNCTVRNNEAAFNGGAFNVQNPGTELRVYDSEFSGNKSHATDNANGSNAWGGGVFYMNTGYPSVYTDNCTFTGNSADKQGGVAFVFTATYEDHGSVFENNTAVGSAGAVKAAGVGGDANQRAKVTLYGSRFVNNRTEDTGGAVQVGGGTLECYGDVYFERNSAKNGGGAVMVSATVGGGAKIIGSKGENAKFVSNGSDSGHGGAIYNEVNKLELQGYTFEKNTAGNQGGAVGLSGGDFDIDDCEFTGNTAVNFGGAMLIYSSKNNGVITGCRFYKNSCAADNYGGNPDFGGGAIYANISIFTLNNCHFEENDSAYDGGAIYLREGSECTDNGSSFINNTAFRGGGAIAIHGGVGGVTGKLNLNATAGFTGNTAGDFGGALYIHGATAVGYNTDFSGNRSGIYGGEAGTYVGTHNGGAIYIGSDEHATAKLDLRSTAENNKFENNESPGEYGGAIYSEGCESIIEGYTFKTNHADAANGKGGAFGINGQVTVTDCVFDSNTAGADGGALKVRGSGSLTAENCKFIGNTAANGGAIHSSGGAVTLTGGADALFQNNRSIGGGHHGGALNIEGTFSANGYTFDGNHSDATGGAAIIWLGTADFTNCTFKNNTAATDGGALNLQNRDNAGSTVTVTDTAFISNSAQGGSGGAIYLSGATLTLTGTGDNALFQDNGSVGGGHHGGAMCVVKDVSVLKATGYTFDGNHSDATAGAFMIHTGTADFTKCTFKNNTAATDGGACNIYKSGAATTVSFTDTEFSSNKSNGGGHGGGVIYMNGSTVILSGGSFKDNTAKTQAGAIDIENGAILKSADNAPGTLFEGNKTLNNWANYGAIAVNGSTVDLTANGGDAKFLNNKVAQAENGTDGHAGAIGITGGGYLKLHGYTFEGNEAKTHGGAIAIWENNGSVTLENCVFNKNTASQKAGALYLAGQTTATVTNTVFTGNVSNNPVLNDEANKNRSGGAVYVEPRVTLGTVHCTFGGDTEESGNKAAAGGGGAIVVCGTYTDKGNDQGPSVFSHNSSAGNGGAICVDDSGSAALTGTKFTANVSHMKKAENNIQGGGAVYVNSGATLSTVACIFGGDTEGDGNKADAAEGGAIFAFGSYTDKNSVFSHNSSAVSGGAVKIAGTAGSADAPGLDGTEFDGNTSNEGGALAVGGGKVYGKNVKFTDNQAKSGSGGAVNVTSTASSELHLTGDNADKAVFSGNTSGLHGGALCVGGGKGASVTGYKFTGNKANNQGGAVGVMSTNLTLTDCSVTGNTAVNGGGGLLIYNGTATVTNTPFEGNKTERTDAGAHGGGAIYMNSEAGATASLTLAGDAANKTRITGNHSANKGGAITAKCTGTTKITATNYDFSGNTAANGSNVCYKEGNTDVSGVDGTSCTGWSVD